MRELNLYRRVLLGTVDELLAQGAAPEEVVHARRLMLELVDRSVNASVEQYTVALKRSAIWLRKRHKLCTISATGS